MNRQEVSGFDDAMPLAIAYVPWQKWQKIYDPQVGLHRGTIFEELDLPYTVEEAIPRG